MSKKLVISLAVWVVYIFMILFMPKLYSGGGQQSQSDFASSGISIAHFIAVAFLLAFIFIAGWSRDAGLKMPRPGTNWLILWLPLTFIVLFFSLGLFLGFKSGPAMLIAAINTVAIGVGEELAFRGVLFAGARSQFNTWGAIIYTSFIFGAIHVLNGLGTGDFVKSSVQAVSAMLSGFLFIAILIRTGSLIPGMIIHLLWDLSIFASSTKNDSAGGSESTSWVMLVMPILFVTPNFLYALWLLRGVGQREPEEVV